MKEDFNLNLSAEETSAKLIRQLYADAFVAGHVQRMGLLLVSLSSEEVRAELTVSSIHHQPMGIVHGGVYCSIVEETCSMGALARARASGGFVVGLDNQTSFLKATRSGRLRARARPLTAGKRTQLWEASIWDDDDVLVATGRVRLLGVDATFVVGDANHAIESERGVRGAM